MDSYERITAMIISMLEAGDIPWHRPWNGTLKNLRSGKEYRGINIWLLGGRKYSSPYWLTFRQAKEMGGHVKAGEKSATVVFWKLIPKKTNVHILDEDGNEVVEYVPYLRTYNVFNVIQTTLPVPEIETRQNDPIQAAEAIVAGMPRAPPIGHGDTTRAYYSPSGDEVNVPEINLFDNAQYYYNVLFHELTHSTGHASRLGRFRADADHTFGSNDYSQEELVAEMGAAFLSGQAGIERETVENSAAYIQSWLKSLKNDKKMVVIAAAQAQKAADFILDRREN